MTSRNEKCPCGSGKKFKRCCLPKWEAEHKLPSLKKNIDVKFEKLPESQITEARAKEVVARMQRGMARLDPFIRAEKLKQSWWRRLLNKII